jgi:hypothetical protein
VVLLYSAVWHEEQVVDVPAYLPPMWHRSQATGVWAPVRANLVVLWLNTAPFHWTVVWQMMQFWLKPAAT